VIVPTISGLVIVASQNPAILKRDLLLWAVIVALVEMVPVPLWRGTQVSMSFPILMAVAFLDYAPVAAALTALVGSFDLREFKRGYGLSKALFNRCQIALAVLVASAIFHQFADLERSVPLVWFLSALLAAVADYLVNSSLVTLAASLDFKMAPQKVIRELRIGRLSEFVVSFVGMGAVGLILARFFSLPRVGFWSVPVFVVPLVLFRQMFFRSKSLEEAHKELQDREQVLRALSNRMAEERQDERAQIAAYLHDDLAQLLFKLSLQVDIARRHLAAGKISQTAKTLEEIKDTKAKTSDRIRALIRDLHRSPLGRAGLAEALLGFIAETGRGSEVRFHTDIAEVPLPPPIALLVYHIAREGVMNTLKHAEASNVWLTVAQDGDTVELVLKDDGAGFDAEAPGPEGHYGLTMMRERALVGGGTFDLTSSLGRGTELKVRFPTLWLQQEGSEGPAQPEPQNPVDASPGTAQTHAGGPAAESVLA
jgi:signal transduction histidine kinase